MNNKIVVVGSSNTDMVLKTTRFPMPGETILGGDFFIFQGGKGANQAVAASRLGGNVSFICRVGNDVFGNNALQHYNNEQINTSGISMDDTAPTGVAMITINEEGENCIIVASGANAFLSVKDLQNAGSTFFDASFIVAQLETPVAVIEYLSAYAQEHHKHFILNPAPARQLPDAVYKDLFLITPNESETELLTGIRVTDEADCRQAASVLKLKGVLNVIITLGSEGAFCDCNGYQGLVESYKVKATDTTAAGDVFNGALAVALSAEKPWKEAVQFACKAAAISVTKMGAQASAPTVKEMLQNI